MLVMMLSNKSIPFFVSLVQLKKHDLNSEKLKVSITLTYLLTAKGSHRAYWHPFAVWWGLWVLSEVTTVKQKGMGIYGKKLKKPRADSSDRRPAIGVALCKKHHVVYLYGQKRVLPLIKVFWCGSSKNWSNDTWAIRTKLILAFKSFNFP